MVLFWLSSVRDRRIGLVCRVDCRINSVSLCADYERVVKDAPLYEVTVDARRVFVDFVIHELCRAHDCGFVGNQPIRRSAASRTALS